jgi:glyoxylase-like metal-dependent hydrolase (beta-lactamase superfamily II)
MKINIKSLSLGALEANCYLVWDTERNAVIIDPGDEADFIIQTLESLDLSPQAIIATHGHFDHVMAALELKLAYKIPFYMHRADEFLLDRMPGTAMHFINFDPGPPPDVDIYLNDKSKLKILSCELKIIHTPGHTPGSVSIYIKETKAVFVGDLVFSDNLRGRTDFSYSDKGKLVDSIELIRKLPKETIIYPGHGESFTLRRKRTQREKPLTN